MNGGPSEGGVLPFRPLDYVMVKGKTEALLVCQPFDPDDAASHALLGNLPLYEKAFAAWTEGKLTEALALYQELGARVPDDHVVTMHTERIRRFLVEGVPEPWSPAVKVRDK